MMMTIFPRKRQNLNNFFEFEPLSNLFDNNLDDIFLDRNDLQKFKLLEKNHNSIFELQLPLGNIYTPEEINLQIEENKLIIIGKHFEKNEQGYDCQEFSRQFTLPDDIKLDSMKHRFSKRGNLIVEFEKIIPEIRYPIENISNDDQYIIKFDVKGFTTENVNVNLNGKQLIVEGKIINDDSQIVKQFKKLITIPLNVDCSTLKTIWKNDEYLYIEANYFSSNTLCQSRKLEIQTE